MKKNRNSAFDINRIFATKTELELNMEAELEQLKQIIVRQEATISQYTAQIGTLQGAGPSNMQQQQHFLKLTPENILSQYRYIKPFNGSDDYTLSSFIKSVENVMQLSRDNEQLTEYALNIVFNEKIQGNAARCIRRLGDNTTWISVKRELMQNYQPNRSYGELFNYCRYVKVTNLRELFNEFKEVNYKLNEMYEFDEKKPDIYRPENIDRDLTEILIEKIDGNIRAHILENENMTTIYNKYSRLKLLDDNRAIDSKHKKIYNNSNHYNKNTFSNRPNNNYNNSNQSKNYNDSNHYNTNNYKTPNHSKNYNNYNRFNYNGNSNRSNIVGNSNQYANNYNNHRSNYQNYQDSSQNGQNILKPKTQQNPEPMEIDNFQEVNFLKTASNSQLPLIYITFGQQSIKALIDTGSTTSVINPNIIQHFKEEKLETPIYFTTINGTNKISNKKVTPIPNEFNTIGTISWKVVELPGRNYDAILGQNILSALNAKIDLENKYIEINEKKILFIQNEYPFDINNVQTLETQNSTLKQDLKLDHLNDEERNYLTKLFKDIDELTYKENEILTFSQDIYHEIITTTNNPVYSKMYRYPQVHEEEITRQIQEMIDQHIIRESNSPYNSPLWIVPKKKDNSGKQRWRLVVDYRKLNEVTINDKFPIPNIDGILDKLGRSQYFTTLDLAKGFHQILMNQEDIRKTAFSTSFGHYEYMRMPFGLKNAPSTFQRLMNFVLKNYINKTCVVYLDDILIFSTSLKEHIINLKNILDRLKSAGLKIQIDKCNFLKKETEFLGHILTPEGIKPNPNKIEIIKSLKLPTNEKQIKSFLGITGYYRKFIKNYAHVAQPMTKYLKKNTKTNMNDPNYIIAFEKLKDLITDHPILRYPDFNKKFRLITDASNFALGAVLTQDNHPICYASRTLNDHEKNYSTIEKELLAIVWATKYFRPYIYGKKFDLYTDHQPIKWLHAKYKGRDINPRLQRWLIQLGEYNFDIEYIKGKDNKIADFLSRINKDTNEINEITDNSQANIPILETVVNRFKVQLIIIDQKDKEFETVFNNKRIFIDRNDIKVNFRDIIRRNINNGKIGIYTDIENSEYNIVKQYLIEFLTNNSNIKFVRCKYFAKDILDEEQVLRQISLYHKKESGHSGIIANYEGIKNKIFHPNLKLLINTIVNNCDICGAAKYDRRPIKKKYEFTETASKINEIIHLDTYTNSKHSFINFIDKFSKHAVSFYLEDRNSKTLIEKIRQFTSIKGKMKKIVCDNEFNCINVKEFCRVEQIEIHFVKPNSHTGNSDIERLNNTLTERIRTLNLEEKIPIKEQILKSIELYNNSYHSTIKATPLEVQNGLIPEEIIKKRIENKKKIVIEKLNRKRENYEEMREHGFIKNYASLRHKEQPKYRKYNLSGIHENNIKRPLKFTEQNNTPLANNCSDATTNSNNPPEHAD